MQKEAKSNKIIDKLPISLLRPLLAVITSKHYGNAKKHSQKLLLSLQIVLNKKQYLQPF